MRIVIDRWNYLPTKKDNQSYVNSFHMAPKKIEQLKADGHYIIIQTVEIWPHKVILVGL